MIVGICLRALWGLALAFIVSAAAQAQPFPSKTVRLVNPFPPGGPLDLIGRALTERLSASLGTAVIIENKPGAAGSIGAAEVAKAPPDGHTLLLTLYSIVTNNPHLYDKLPFDPLKDFAPITALATTDAVLIAHPLVQAVSVAELIAFAKANPGKLKALAVYLTNGIDELPGARSLAAQGIEGFDLKSQPFWYGLLAPAGTPREVVMRIHADTLRALRDDKVAAAFRTARIFPIGNTPDEFVAMIREGHAAWGQIIRETGVKGE